MTFLKFKVNIVLLSSSWILLRYSFFFYAFFIDTFLSNLISIFFLNFLLLKVTSSLISKTILLMSEFEPNLKFTISEEINSLLDNKNMIYKTNLIEAFNLDYFNLLYYI